MPLPFPLHGRTSTCWASEASKDPWIEFTFEETAVAKIVLNGLYKSQEHTTTFDGIETKWRHPKNYWKRCNEVGVATGAEKPDEKPTIQSCSKNSLEETTKIKIAFPKSTES